MKQQLKRVKIVLEEKGYDHFIEVKSKEFDMIAFNRNTRQILFVKSITGKYSEKVNADLLKEFAWLSDEWIGGYFINTL